MTASASSSRCSEAASRGSILNVTARFEGLDALRAAAMLLGIMVHAAVPYMPTRMPSLLWPVHDAHPVAFCDAVFWAIHVFRLPVYFVLSGYFAERLFQQRGAREFLKHRLQRLVKPFVVSLCTLNMLTFLIFAWGWYLTGRCTIEQIFNPFVFFTPDIQSNFFGPAHLWFLADLILMSLVFWAIRRESGVTVVSDGIPQAQAPGILMPVLFALPTAMILWGSVGVVVAFNNSFIPDPPRLLYFGIYFVCGVMFCRHSEWFLAATRFSGIHVAASLPLTMLSVAAIHRELDSPCTGNQLLTGLSVSLAAWFSIFGWFGVFVHYWRRSTTLLRYLSDSSYWIYLCHLPLVALAQILLHSVPLSAMFKFSAVTGFALFGGLLTYAMFVRHTVIGQTLHGPRAVAKRGHAADRAASRPSSPVFGRYPAAETPVSQSAVH